MNPVKLGDMEIDLNPLLSQADRMPQAELVWQHPDVVADLATRMALVNDPAEKSKIFDMLEPASLLLAAPTHRTGWQHLNLLGVKPNARLYSLIMLHDQNSHLSQQDYNFLCCTDIEDATLSISKRSVDEVVRQIAAEMPQTPDILNLYKDKALRDMTMDPGQRRLGEAFVKMMVQEAEPHRLHLLGGAFEMERVSLPFLDELIDYDKLRLVIQPGGIRGSLVYGEKYSPFFWSPKRTTLWLKGAQIAWALQVVAASIWRDACVVRHEFVTERRRSIYQPRPRQPREKKAVTVLPRVIRHVVWSSDEERERIIRQAHSVKQHYRELPPGWQTSEEAVSNAKFYGWPEPPGGWTFVKPHTRGEGQPADQPAARKIICKGLQVARLALSLK